MAEAAAVGIPHDVKGEVAWVFCVLMPGGQGCESLALEVKSVIGSGDLSSVENPDAIAEIAARL